MNKIWYTDGACSGNPGPGGWAAVEINESLPTIQVINTLIGKEDFTTNNKMELTAILEVCKIAEKDPSNTYYIYSDSAYAVNICNDWMWKWAANGWTRGKNKKIENFNLVQQLYHILKKDFCNIEINKIAGHKGDIGNEYADALASGNKLKENFLKQQISFIDKNKNI